MDPLYAACALLLVAAAGACILVLSTGGDEQGSTAPQTPAAPPDAGPSPTLEVRTESAGRPFTASEASFLVIPNPSGSWTEAIVAEDPGASRQWVLVSIEVVNVDRSRFNPALLSYRLRGAGGDLYSPDRGGVVGPNELGTSEGLPRGARAEERLAFRVPSTADRLSLAFEPTLNGPRQVRVPLSAG